MQRATLPVLVGLALAVAVAPVHADAPKHPKVGVVPGIAVNLDAARVDALGQDLADALNAQLEVDAIGGLEVRRLLPPDGVAPDCVTTPACVADVAKRLGASQLLFVVMVDTGSGGAIQIDTTWIDPATGKTGSRPPVDVTEIADATAKFSAAAHQLLPDATVRATPVTGPIGPVPPHVSGDAVPRHFTTLSYVTGGVAIVGLGLGIGFGASARSQYNSCLSTVCTQDQKDGIRHRDLFADTGWALAVAGAVATSILFMTSGHEALVVAPSAEGVSVGVAGRF